MENILFEIFTNVNDWLKHAEAKNTGILVYFCALLAIITGFIYGVQLSLNWFTITICISILLAVIGIIMAIASFVPCLNTPSNKDRNSVDKFGNLIFYMNIKNYSREEYLMRFAERYDLDINKLNKLLCLDYCEQIINNSRIAYKKYLKFKVNVWFAIGCIAFLGMAVIFYAFF